MAIPQYSPTAKRSLSTVMSNFASAATAVPSMGIFPDPGARDVCRNYDRRIESDLHDSLSTLNTSLGPKANSSARRRGLVAQRSRFYRVASKYNLIIFNVL
jgi:hypothetical protein